MLLLYSAADLLGALVTALLLGQHSVLLGLMAAPFGGSLSIAAAAALILLRGGSPHLERKTVPPGVVWC
jgi:hypothetical protein